MFKLSTRSGDQAPQLIPRDQHIVRIGRDAKNDFVTDVRQVSSFHCELQQSGNEWTLRDLQSTNGTSVRRSGRLISVDQNRDFQVALWPGDEIWLGEPENAFILDLRSTSVRPEQRPVQHPGQLVIRADEIDSLSTNFDRAALLALHQHAAGMAGIDDEEQLNQHFARCVLDLFVRASHVSVHMRAADNDPLLPALVLDREGHAEHLPISRTIRQLVMETGHAVAFMDNDDLVDESESLQAHDVRAGMCAPLVVSDEIIGFTQVDCRQHQVLNTFKRNDLEVFAVLTQQFAMASENTRLTRQLRTTVRDLERTHAEMEQLAFYDALTGLSNRRLFMDRLEQAVHSAERGQRWACLLYLDLDQFKQVNDTLGHDAGDALLKSMSNRLRACVRSNDTVARIGGDEFAIVLGDVESVTAVQRVCEKLLEVLRQPVVINHQEVVISTSIGIAMSNKDGSDAGTMLKNADMALYKAKSRGRDNFQFFTEEMNRELSERVYLESQLRGAVARGELLELFQPLLDLNTNKVIGVEALMRWHHPERGIIKPDDFIWLAEESGLIMSIGEWAVREAFKALSEHTGDPTLGLSVNLAARQLADADVVETISGALEEFKLDPQRVVLEITETTLLQTSQALPNLNRLKDLGVQLAIDDFGTGYSSLSYLKELPVDVLKLDRSFVSAIPARERDAEIATAVIAMAHKLNIRVVAEGIENEAQLEFLRRHNCDYGQGYLLGEPMEFERAAIGIVAPVEAR